MAPPLNLSFEQAAAVPISGFAALQGLRDEGELQPGQKARMHTESRCFKR
jgi:NADPH:quinone reductase-like Zn-dependent oxidoreductase